MLNYSFALSVPVATLTAFADLALPAVKSCYLIHMSTFCTAIEPGPPVVNRYVPARVQVQSLPAIAVGEIANLTPVAPTIVPLNFGWPFASDAAPYYGCWPIPVNKFVFRVTATALAPAGYTFPALTVLNYNVQLQFDVEQ